MERLLFRAHTDIELRQYWHDVGYRGTVRLEIRSESFWTDIHRDVGEPDDDADPARLLVFSYMSSNTPDTVTALLNSPPSCLGTRDHHRSKAKSANYVPQKNGDQLEQFPIEYRNFLRSTAHQMSRLTNRALEVAFWRSGARGGPPEISFYPPLLSWRTMNAAAEPTLRDKWRQVPAGVLTLEMPDVSFFDLDNAIAHDISQLLDAGVQQPLGHDLLREAWRIHESSPRAALVLLVAAVETGVKEFVATQLPQTEWLLHNLPSPPLHKLLRDFLPMVPSKAGGHDRFPAVDASIVRALKEAVEARNSTVHVGRSEIAPDWLVTVFTASRRLLYELDYHSGHDWAPQIVDNVQPWGREWYNKQDGA